MKKIILLFTAVVLLAAVIFCGVKFMRYEQTQSATIKILLDDILEQSEQKKRCRHRFRT